MTPTPDALRALVAEMAKAAQVSRSAGGSGVNNHLVEVWADRLESLIGAGGWLPIESAPRDGTYVLAFNPFWKHWGACGVVAFDGVHELWMEGGFSVEPAPTRWRPLPELPTPPGASDDR